MAAEILGIKAGCEQRVRETSATPITQEDGALSMASLKRQIAFLEREIRKQTDRPSGRKRSTTTVTLGRGTSRVVSMFTPLSVLVEEADARLNPLDIVEEVTEAMQIERDRNYKSYKLLVALIPNLEAILADDDPNKPEAFVADLQKGANEARADDIRRVKEELAVWLNDLYNPELAFSPKTREGRGIQNDVTGRLLCPISYDWDDESVRTKIRNLEYDINDDFCITALYPKEMFNIMDLEKGYLRSGLLVKTWSCLYLSPSSVDAYKVESSADGPTRKKPRSDSPAKARRSSVATLLRMNGKVTPRSIAYAATLLLFNLSNASQWPSKGTFDYQAFYNFIIDYFEVYTDAESKAHTDELLAWWNRTVFPHHAASKASADAAWKRLIAARAERSKARARARAQAASAPRADAM